MKVFYLNDGHNNVGDNLNGYILNKLMHDVEYVGRSERNKFLGIGSIITCAKEGDVIWGSGLIRQKIFNAPKDTKFLAVRGPLTRDLIKKAVVPKIYGDPGLLVSRFYNPIIEKKYSVGIIPHYVDKDNSRIKNISKIAKIIDVQQDPKSFIHEVKECETIISSSLHGIVIAESYGIQCEWVKLSDKVIGDGFKFKDYLAGTDREVQGPGLFPKIPDLFEIQERLINALQNYEK